MRKYILFCFIWTVLLSVPNSISSKSAQITYQIIYDSSMKDVQIVKDEIVEQARSLFESVHEDSYETMMKHSLNIFEKDNRKVSFQNHQLNIVIGDGKGKSVNGTFTKNSFCLSEVKPRSYVMELFNWQ